jgi:hypothetical protein
MTPAVLAVAAILAQQSPCGPTGQVEARIAKQYGESVVGAGVTPGGIMFITANPVTGTFTVMLRKGGQTCILQGGTGYATVEAIQPGEKI